MKTQFILALIAFSSLLYLSNGYKERNILYNEYKDKTKSLNDINVWRTHLKEEVHKNLNALPENVKKVLIESADNSSKTSWPSLSVMELLEFVINGNRDHFEGHRADRRKKLVNLIIGEMLTEKGKYMNEIANGVWLILEESTWVWPAHLGAQKAGAGLPDPTEYIIDLGVGEASSHMAWIKLLMGEKLTKINPMFPKRIDFESNRRIIRPFLDRSDFGWMGLKGQVVNNWNIWINTNVLMTALLSVDNQTIREELMTKAVQSGDKFLNFYGEDGGCDEGPSYWRQAGARLIEFLNFMTSASGNQINWSSNKLIHSIGEYIYKMHINKDRFVNFADASGKLRPDPSLVLKYGTLFNDEKLKGFASYFYQMEGNESVITSAAGSGDINAFVNAISAYPLLKTIPPKAPQPLESWLPDLQVITLRSQEGSANGLFLGAKAGTNHESHNHNDVGNFVLYVNGMPAIIDVGVGVYTAQTFNSDRYKLWYMQSQWHNTPTINGIQQHDGNAYESHNVKYTQTPTGGEFEADIAGAYPTEAQVKSWVRKLTFNRNTSSVIVKDTYVLNKFVEPFKIHYITILNETHKTNGMVGLKDKDTSLNIHFDESLADAVIDQHKTEDKHLAESWGELVTRVTLVSKNKDSLSGEFSTTFKLN